LYSVAQRRCSRVVRQKMRSSLHLADETFY